MQVNSLCRVKSVNNLQGYRRKSVALVSVGLMLVGGPV